MASVGLELAKSKEAQLLDGAWADGFPASTQPAGLDFGDGATCVLAFARLVFWRSRDLFFGVRVIRCNLPVNSLDTLKAGRLIVMHGLAVVKQSYSFGMGWRGGEYGWG